MLNKRKTVEEYIFMFIGSTLLALAISIFYSPNHMVVGGITGIGITLERVTFDIFGKAFPLWLTNILLNIPIVIMGYKALGRKYMVKTLIMTVYFSAVLAVMETFTFGEMDLVLAALYGGAVQGVGLGLVLRGMASTGGIDLLATIIHKKHSHVSVAKIIFFIDATIIVSGFFVFGYAIAMYAVLSVFISSKFIDTVLEGMNFSKAMFIITEKSDEISNEILYKAKRGVTRLLGEGMFSGNPKAVIFCVFAQKEFVKIRDIVKECDPSAFVMVTDVREVLGEGFNLLE